MEESKKGIIQQGNRLAEVYYLKTVNYAEYVEHFRAELTEAGGQVKMG